MRCMLSRDSIRDDFERVYHERDDLVETSERMMGDLNAIIHALRLELADQTLEHSSSAIQLSEQICMLSMTGMMLKLRLRS